MKTAELRIGNLIENVVTHEINKVAGIDGDFKVIAGEQYWKDLSFFKPVPITEEWLVDVGFTDDSLPEQYSEMGPVNCLKLGRLSLSFQDGMYDPVRKYDNIQHLAYGAGLEYVHQLQNFYFALNGEELDVNF